MEIKGDEFLKNVQKKQEEENLRKRLNEFEQQREQPQNQTNPYEELSRNSDDQELSDILLNSKQPAQEQQNKKKYVMLAVALALLFIITLVIIRLITSDENNMAFNESSTIQQDQVLDDQKIQQEYQQILNEKLKKVDSISTSPIPQQDQPTQENPLAIEEEPNEEGTANEEGTQQEPQVAAPTSKKEAEKTTQQPVQQQQTQSVKKETPKPTPAPKPTTSTTAQGIFIQIGAFSKKPSNDYLSDISKKGYNFKLHNTTVNSKEVVKVLIGPYASRNEATQKLEEVRKAFEVPGAYILQL